MSKNKPVVRFQQADAKARLAGRSSLKSFIIERFKAANCDLDELSYVFCSDDFLYQMNQQFLQHDTFTDIITFPLHEAGEPIKGEIYISLDRVRENAQSLGVTFPEELHRVIFHGALHLIGQKDKSRAEKKKMRSLEDEWLKSYQLFHVEHKS